jgi:hypothetical protein
MSIEDHKAKAALAARISLPVSWLHILTGIDSGAYRE